MQYQKVQYEYISKSNNLTTTRQTTKQCNMKIVEDQIVHIETVHLVVQHKNSGTLNSAILK